jgi:peptidyl-prolyl cis-trans isomerase C
MNFQRGMGTIDAISQNPKLITAIVGLPPQEVFILSAGNQVLVNLIRNTRTQPFTGDAATKYTSNVLRAQHTQDAVRKQLGSLVATGLRGVQIAKEYQPPPKSSGPSSPAAGTASPAATGGVPKGG